MCSLVRPWPVHPQPLPDELFSSWMARAAISNGEKLSRFLRLTIPDFKSVTKSIDGFISPEMMKSVSDRMRTPFHKVYDTTLDSYAGELFEVASGRSHHKHNILSTGETRREHYFQQYCPLCLSEGIPYYRKIWRISFVTVCCKHGCTLQDRCSNCGLPIMVMNNKTHDRYGEYRGTLTACHGCLYDLKGSLSEPAEREIIADTNMYLRVLQRGFFLLSADRWVYSFSFFSVLRHMIKLYVERMNFPEFNGKVIDPDNFPLKIRYAAMVDMMGIFRNWPDNFIHYCQSRDINYSQITPIEKTCNGIVPFWLSDAIKPHCYFPNIEPSQDSVQGAVTYMRGHDMRINISSVNRLMGFRDSNVIKKIVKRVRR